MFRLVDPPPFVTPQVGWPIVAILFLLLLLITIVSLRREKVKRDRAWLEAMRPIQHRSTYVAAQNMRSTITTDQEITNAFTNQTRTDHH